MLFNNRNLAEISRTESNINCAPPVKLLAVWSTFALILFTALLSNTKVFAADIANLLDLSLEELTSIKVVSATKYSEKRSQSPVSISSISSEQIIAHGINTIPEALQLIPGLLVKESPAGIYRVYNRGLDCPYYSCDISDTSQKSLLVMINRRPVYNYYSGGIWWESLPITVHDIETIEVIRGPSASLYGPNAVEGVIHLITRKNTQTKHTTTETQITSNPDAFNQLFVNHQTQFITGSLRISAHSESQQRDQETYFHYRERSYVPAEALVSSSISTPVSERYPKPKLSYEKQGVNIHWDKLTRRGNLSISFGQQESMSQKLFTSNGITPLSTYESDSYYFDFRLQSESLYTQISYQGGRQEALGLEEIDYKFKNLDASIERHWSSKSYRLTTGLNFRESHYEGDLIDGERGIHTRAYYLQLDTLDFENWQINASLRADDYDKPSGTFWNGLLSVQYFIDPKQSIRSTLATSYQSPQILRSFLDLEVGIPGVFTFNLIGNPELEPLYQEMFELGYRSQFFSQAFLEIEWFTIRTDQFRDSNQVTPTLFQYQTLDHEVRRHGTTISIEQSLKDRSSIRYHLTWVDIKRNGDINTTDSAPAWESPSWYGGVYFNYGLANDWYWSVHANLTDEQTITRNNSGDTVFNSETIKATAWINTNLVKQISSQLRWSVGVKHLRFGDDKQDGLVDELAPLGLVQLWVEM